ncbi:EVE domain-containing protein [Gammaproteobacteria bacterium]|nr:EVE domain-containing protein [Gammaproteobacteria bacterium]
MGFVEMMPSAQYWLCLFTVETWDRFLYAGGEVIGFNEGKLSAAKKIEIGDRVICYLTGVSAVVAVMEVRGSAFVSREPIWGEGEFPVRIAVTNLVQTQTNRALQIQSLRDKLTIFKGRTKNSWSIWVRTSPRLWKREDGEKVYKALKKVRQSVRVGEIPQVAREEVVEFPVVNFKPPSKLGIPKTAVGRIIRKTSLIAKESQGTKIKTGSVLSYNKVTGYSVNFPIWQTCKPTRVCAKYCYFATGHNSWTNAIKHQLRNLYSIKNNFQHFADKVALEYDKNGLSFIRWNGGGDLFPESVAAVNYLAVQRPDIIFWVVTRIPDLAAEIRQLPNVFIHFSLDRYSLKRREKFEALGNRSENFFYSYQAEAHEVPDRERLKGCSVMFFDDYRPPQDYSEIPTEILCPLNEANDISNTCDRCRRCFDGSAVNYRKQ